MKDLSKPSKESLPIVQTRWVNIIVVLSGLVSLVVSLLLLKTVVRQRQSSGWVDFCLYVLFSTAYLGASVAMILYPVRQVRLVRHITQIALWPLAITVMAAKSKRHSGL